MSARPLPRRPAAPPLAIVSGPPETQACVCECPSCSGKVPLVLHQPSERLPEIVLGFCEECLVLWVMERPGRDPWRVLRDQTGRPVRFGKRIPGA
jgi:hypothetical protein